MPRRTTITYNPITYALGGQVVATRIINGSSTLYYIHNDHPSTSSGQALGSNSRMSTSAGSAVTNSIARYTPFGDWRTEPTAGLTDRGYTSHLHNNLGSGSDDIGLIYMNARYYLPSLNRFISPDTIVPDPINPQSYNRYSYTYNNPVRYLDPTGHFVCQIGSDGENAGISTVDCENWVYQALGILGLTETGAQIVNAFWIADAAIGEGGIKIMVGGTIAAAVSRADGTVSYININDFLGSEANFIGDTMYLKPETILADPLDPNNWAKVGTFAHESIHAAQGFWNAWSVYGEAEAYYYEYQLVEEMNILIASYNSAGDPNDPLIGPVEHHYLGTLIHGYGTAWNDPATIEAFGQNSAFDSHPTNGWLWVSYTGGAIPWQ